MITRRFRIAVAAGLTTAIGSTGVALAATSKNQVGPSTHMTPNGRVLQPDGRMTMVRDFPTGGALSPDGRYYWAVNSGYGHDDVAVVSVATGKVTQTLPLPGAYGGTAFSSDGTHGYVSGEPQGVIKAAGPTKADGGDAIHVFSIDRHTGRAEVTEYSPNVHRLVGGTGPT